MDPSVALQNVTQTASIVNPLPASDRDASCSIFLKLYGISLKIIHLIKNLDLL